MKFEQNKRFIWTGPGGLLIFDLTCLTIPQDYLLGSLANCRINSVINNATMWGFKTGSVQLFGSNDATLSEYQDPNDILKDMLCFM